MQMASDRQFKDNDASDSVGVAQEAKRSSKTAGVHRSYLRLMKRGRSPDEGRWTMRMNKLVNPKYLIDCR